MHLLLLLILLNIGLSLVRESSRALVVLANVLSGVRPRFFFFLERNRNVTGETDYVFYCFNHPF